MTRNEILPVFYFGVRAVLHVAPQHGVRVVTIDYCDVSTPSPLHASTVWSDLGGGHRPLTRSPWSSLIRLLRHRVKYGSYVA